MTTVMEEFKSLQEYLTQARITYHIAGASYILPKKQLGTDTAFDEVRGVIDVDARYGRSVVPQESLMSPLTGLTIGIDNFGDHDLSKDTVFLDVELNRRIDLHIAELYGDDNVQKAKDLEQAVRQISQHLSYEFSVARD